METIEDILRDMRVGAIPRHRTDREMLCGYADRIEVAHKREIADALDTGAFVAEAHKQPISNCNGLNGAKMREALESIANNLENRLFSRYPCSATDVWMLQKARTALSAPPRNCDVATEGEAMESFRQTIPLDGLSENDINIVTACIKDIVGTLYTPYKEGETK